MDGEPGNTYYDGEPENYVLPIAWTFYYAQTEADAASGLEGDFSTCKKVGTVYGSLIQCDEMETDGWDPVLMCDDMDADLGELMSRFTEDGGPFDEANDDYPGNILYIHKFEVKPGYENTPIKDRILRELPWICKRMTHIFPEILAYLIGYGCSEKEAGEVRAYYTKNGFCALDGSALLYAYTQ